MRPTTLAQSQWNEIAAQYRRRAALYARWHECLNAKTNFFAAASLTNRVLGHVVSVARTAAVSNSIERLSMLGASLQATNLSLARAVQRSEIAGPRLDEYLVFIEQCHVERWLRRARHQSFYPRLISEVDILLNQHQAISAWHLSAAVRCYSRVLQKVRADLCAPIEFDRQVHRQAIGFSLTRAIAARS